MNQHVTVKVEAINGDYGYTLVEVCAMGAKPMSFVIQHDSASEKYHFSQTGENNDWYAYADERK